MVTKLDSDDGASIASLPIPYCRLVRKGKMQRELDNFWLCIDMLAVEPESFAPHIPIPLFRVFVLD